MGVVKKPRFKIDGRSGRLRSKQPDGSLWVRTGLLQTCWDEWSEAVLSGIAEGVGQMQLTVGKGTWHDVELTPAEARDEILERKPGGVTVRRCERVRKSRTQRRLPVCGVLDA